jgi:hypothetical protein
MTDTSPLQKVRKALAKLKAEIKDMELRIGVVGHSLLQASLKYAQEARIAKKNGKVEGPASPLNAAASNSKLAASHRTQTPESRRNFTQRFCGPGRVAQ